jgi:hypothetical protein
MSRFFFHLTSSYDTPDDVGVELDNLAAARCHAVKMIADVLCQSPGEYWKAEIYRVTVTDQTRLILFTVEVTSMDAAAIGNSKQVALTATLFSPFRYCARAHARDVTV